MKKSLALYVIGVLSIGLLTGCGESRTTESTNTNDTKRDSVALQIVTSYGGEDANRTNFEAAVAEYEEQSGNTIIDGSGTSNEEWKAKVMTDFETGTEPDVLFYFTGSDADKLVAGQKVVSIDTIRAEYKDFASNLNDDLLPKSTYDNQQYAVPVNGYWEGLYVNEVVLEEAGVLVPGADYTWEQFLADCEQIKQAGFTPIATSLQEVPHYWFEFVTYNNGNKENHLEIPEKAKDEIALKWASGLQDITHLYEKGYFPENTLNITDVEAVQMIGDNQAAFLIDGSWKINWFKEEANIEDFTVTYVPGKGEREATDIIGGLSMGYYITQKAWKDEAKREAAVDFITSMTTNEVISGFGPTAVTALKNGTTPTEDLSELELAAIDMITGATSVIGAAQDGISQEARGELFTRIQEVVIGVITPQEAIEAALLLK